jgi:hypothetical protein
MAELETKKAGRSGVELALLLVLTAAFVAASALIFVGRINVFVRAGVFFGVIALVLLVKRIKPAWFDRPQARIEIDACGVRRVFGRKVIEQIAWDKLVKVSILTTDEGPSAEDFFWLLHAADGTGCVVTNEQACQADLLSRLQRLPGFDNAAVIESSGSTNRAEFVCWQGTAGQAQVAGPPPTSAPTR